MTAVAIAGGTRALNCTVLDAIAKAGEHKAVVLLGTVSSPMLSLLCNNIKSPIIRQQPATTTNKPRHFAVDYNSVKEIKHISQKNNIEVIVSAMLLVDEGVAVADESDQKP